MTSVLTSSRNLTYQMAYDYCMCLRFLSIFGGYYYFTHVRPYLILVVMATLVLTLYLAISNIKVTCVFSPMTISAYRFFFPISFSFEFVMDFNSSTFPTGMSYYWVGKQIYFISQRTLTTIVDSSI